MTSELYAQAAHLIEARGLHLDDAQQRTLARLVEWLQVRLQPSLWRRRPTVGAYLWGGVGRGKSLLLAALFEAAPLASKRRVHVHALLQEVQQRMLAHVGQADPLLRVADELAQQARLLYLDEFHVHDIGDAILLGRLLQPLIARGCILLFSSNYAPAQLCPNPLYRSRFKPFASLLEKRCLVLEIDAGPDYRVASTQHWGLYLHASPRHLQQRLAHLPTVPQLPLARRSLTLRGMDSRTLWLDFAALCQQPLASSDYLQLCQRFTHLVVGEVPALARCSLDEQQRLVNFVDIAYDSGRELWLHSALALDELCAGVAHEDFSRTRSRLAQLRRERAA
ncbi:Cell division protein ZapE [Pseudomonas sp. 8Z]|uniref:cell division protein ZapE n=1 Tax=Pseudomonas sp. 8Z TaxID=2653166 RepID=UPI0012EFE211|nr:cell division protein ZapE [Pseudomonas sp. 8Z]VXC82171.1 Cell division protein ZapE [Pseudomonas sp. 8Z]